MVPKDELDHASTKALVAKVKETLGDAKTKWKP